MPAETVAAIPEDDRLLLEMFTDIAILEHLVRERMMPFTAGLTARQWGVINYFVRQGKADETLATLAWCFQVDLAEAQEVVDSLVAAGFVRVSDVDGEPCVHITEAGRAKHRESLAQMAPEVRDILGEFALEDLRTAGRVLAEMRRTFDNLPDR